MPEGSVFALVGASGAGKTTTIKILLNMIAPSRGHASILGVDTRSIGPSLLSQVGYVSESQALPGRLRVEQFFDYLRPCYPSWDSQLELQLRRQLRLPPGPPDQRAVAWYAVEAGARLARCLFDRSCWCSMSHSAVWMR